MVYLFFAATLGRYLCSSDALLTSFRRADSSLSLSSANVGGERGELLRMRGELDLLRIRGLGVFAIPFAADVVAFGVRDRRFGVFGLLVGDEAALGDLGARGLRMAFFGVFGLPLTVDIYI